MNLSFGIQLQDNLSHQVEIDWIEPTERLIKNHQVGIGNHCHDELNLLRHPLGQLVNPFTAPLIGSQAFEMLVNQLIGSRIPLSCAKYRSTRRTVIRR